MASPERLTPYHLLRANIYEHLAGKLEEEVNYRRAEEGLAA